MNSRFAAICITVAAAAVLGACKKEVVDQTYVSPSGFRPFVFRTESERITYTMLDVFVEEGDTVTYISRQDIQPGGAFPDGSVHFTRSRSNCKTWMTMDRGQGETVSQMMIERPNEKPYALSNGSSRTAGSVHACKIAKKI